MTADGLTAVMMSCRQRIETREATLAHLRRAGIRDVHVHLSACEPATPNGNLRAAQGALTHAITRPGRPVLFLEDDLILAASFPRRLAEALELDAPVYLFLIDTRRRVREHYPAELAEAIMGEGPIPETRVRLPIGASAYGTQALVLPWRYVTTAYGLTETLAGRGVAFDSALQRLWTADPPREGVWTLVPHPVQHTNAQGGKGVGVPIVERVSWSYGRELGAGRA